MKITCLLVIAVCATAFPALGTPTGLNNIPTADTVGHRTVAVQAFSSFGNGVNQFAANGPGQHSFWTGFKSGWEFTPLRLEGGLDSPLGPGFSGPLFFQTKLAFTPWEDGDFAFGVAGVALTDTRRSGDPFTYAMIAHDFGIARLHLGYGITTRNNSVLLGIERTWKVLGNNLNLNADLVQTQNQTKWLPALGVKYHLGKHVVLESWANLPGEGAASFVGKLNFVFAF